MPIHRFAKVIVLAPAIGSALIGVVGLLIGVALILGHRSENRLHAAATLHASSAPGNPLTDSHLTNPGVNNAKPSRGTRSPAAELSIQPNGARPSSANRIAEEANLRLVSFAKPIAGTPLGILKEYAGQPANGLVRQQGFRDLVSEVVPYVPFHLGSDIPLPNAIEIFFLASTSPLEIREGRYAMLNGVRGMGGRGRAFLWADTQGEIALAGIFFYPSNGEPSPTLTIFSRKVDQAAPGMSHFPAAFIRDLNRWQEAEGVPPVTTRYFINALGEKTVLVHDEDFCSRPTAMPAPASDVCKQMNADARAIDREATAFLKQTHSASNATAHMIAGPSSLDGAAPAFEASYH